MDPMGMQDMMPLVMNVLDAYSYIFETDWVSISDKTMIDRFDNS